MKAMDEVKRYGLIIKIVFHVNLFNHFIEAKVINEYSLYYFLPMKSNKRLLLGMRDALLIE